MLSVIVIFGAPMFGLIAMIIAVHMDYKRIIKGSDNEKQP